MTTGNHDSGHAARRDRGKRSLPKFSLRNWRVRWRLTALILVPTVAGVVLGGARVVTSVESVTVYERAQTAAEQSGRIRDLLQMIGLERDTATWMYIAGAAGKELKGNLTARQREVNDLLKSVQDDLATMAGYGPRVEHAVMMVRTSSNVAKIRADKTPTAYRGLTDALLGLHDELSLLTQDAATIGYQRGLSALARAKEEISQQRYQLLVGYYRYRSVDAQEAQRFIASHSRQLDAQALFGAEAGVDLGMKLRNALSSSDYYNSELTKARAIVLAGNKEAGAVFSNHLIEDPNVWFEQNSKVIDALGGIEVLAAERLAKRVADLRNGEIGSAVIAGVAILVLLVLVLLLTVLIARSMVSPLRRLRTEALDIAGFRLPDVVRKLRITGDTSAGEVRPIDIEGQDEIGEVAKAFDEVHRQAVRLAGEEAELRSNISAMFVNLSRRTQTLVERQISLIDGLEKGEQDGTRLADLFKLDHLATRMRRNSENLLVLAGHEPTRRRSQPAKLVDVVRAALSEVEDYERVQVKVHRSTSVLGSAANDLVHLVAELVENAIQFSPKNSQVGVSSSIIEGGGALLSVSDAGISMTEDELGEANRRLAEPPVVDVSVSRRMGLFVVGRLALRHGIRVQLRKGEGAGLIAMVLLPPTLIPDGSQPQPAAQRPAFGGGTVPAQPAFGAAAQTFNSFGSSSYESQELTAQRGRLTGFTADTDGGAFRQDSGTFPSFPSNPSFPSAPAPADPLPRRQPAQQHPSFPSLEQPAYPGVEQSAYPGVDQQPAHGAFPGAEQPAFPGVEQSGYPGADQPAYPSVEQSAYPGAEQSAYPSLDARPPTEQPPAPGTGAFPTRNGTGAFPAASTGSFQAAQPRPNGGYPTPPATRPPVGQPYTTGESRGREQWRNDVPSVDVSPMEPEQEEFLPIFAAVESAWFRKPAADEQPEAAELPRRDEGAPPQDVPSGEETWRTPADAGWRAAAAASDPSLGGLTSAGLPKRTPKANLVPGTAGQPAQSLSPMPPVSADRVRSRMASFQQGVRRGRAEVVREQEEQE
ncbi:sensor histidine kinase [Nonomuraea typhae]|uniref:sensor histidine kinase n=1 Tax=Nonomuraea typhae TaxID=2603600 RepID=UPI0012F74DEB|nr:nitrate- and nitrite sensing domain-containing protein [Nonomuraea typhae]